MSSQEARAIGITMLIVGIIWMNYGSNHSDNEWVPEINNFWLGAIMFLIFVYIFFEYFSLNTVTVRIYIFSSLPVAWFIV